MSPRLKRTATRPAFVPPPAPVLTPEQERRQRQLLLRHWRIQMRERMKLLDALLNDVEVFFDGMASAVPREIVVEAKQLPTGTAFPEAQLFPVCDYSVFANGVDLSDDVYFATSAEVDPLNKRVTEIRGELMEAWDNLRPLLLGVTVSDEPEEDPEGD